MKNKPYHSDYLLFLIPLFAIVLVTGCKEAPVAPEPNPPKVAIHTAVATGDLSQIKQHIAAGSNLDEPDAMTQSTPLMNAVVFGRIDIAKALIDGGAALDLKNGDGSTALISAAFFCHEELVRALLDAGADPTLRNNAGATAHSTVEGPWEQIRPIYDFVGGLLKPIGVTLDYTRIEATRPKIAEMLGAVDKPKSSVTPETVSPTDPDFKVEALTPTGEEQYIKLASDYIFDQTKLPTFELRIPGSALAKIDADPAKEEYVEGSLTFEGETISPVKIRYKGSVGAWAGGLSGFNPMQPSGFKIRTKLSMKIKFNGMGSENRFYGLNKLQFHSQSMDPSQMRERFGYWLFREMGVPAPRSVHARIVINGKYSGLYALTEQVDGRFARHHFENGKGNVYKEVWPLNSDGQPQAKESYLARLKTNEDDNPSVELMTTFANEIAVASDPEVPEVIAKWMDVKEIVSFAVVDRAIRNDDGPFHWYCFGGPCANHNYYWYEEPTTKRFHLIPWDLDNAFENIINNANPVTPIADQWGDTRANCDPFNHGPFNIPQRSAACDKLTKGWASFAKEYEEEKNRLVKGALSTLQANTLLDTWADQIREATLEASETHDDAISLATWEQAMDQLKAQLEYARSH